MLSVLADIRSSLIAARRGCELQGQREDNVADETHMCASRSIHIDAFVCAAAIFASTLEPSLRLMPSARSVMLPVSSQGTAWDVHQLRRVNSTG